MEDAGLDSTGFTPRPSSTVRPPDIPWLTEGLAPAPPALTPCPPGWQQATLAEVVVCQPYAEARREDCAVGEAHFPGEPGCRGIGDACPSGEFSEGLPTDGSVVYVRDGAPAGGAGTEADPYGFLAEVPWDSLPGGATVALSRGTFAGRLRLSSSARVVGACASETHVTGHPTSLVAVIDLATAGVEAEVRNVTISDPIFRGVRVVAGSLSLRGVFIDRAKFGGVFVRGAEASLTADELVVVDTQPRSADDVLGRGVSIEGGARFEASRLLVMGSHHDGIWISEASEASITDASVEDTNPNAQSLSRGRGISVESGAALSASRIFVARNHEAGVRVGDAESRLTLTDAMITSNLPRPADDNGGVGLLVRDAATLIASRVTIADSRHSGLEVRAGATATIDDVVIVRSTPAPTGLGGLGLFVERAAKVDVTRIAIDQTDGTGILIYGGAEPMTIADARITSSRTVADSPGGGRGISMGIAAHLIARRVHVSDVDRGGYLLMDPQTTLEGSDLFVGDVGLSSDIEVTYGIMVSDGVATLERVHIDRARGIGLLASRATITIEDAIIEGFLAGDGQRTSRGIHAQGEAMVVGQGLIVRRSGEAGIVSVGESMIDLDDVVVEGPSEFGVIATSARLDLSRFGVANAGLCGVLIAQRYGRRQPNVDLSRGRISGAAIGVCLQVTDYDLTRLTREVSYEDNESNLDAIELSVPDTVELAERQLGT